MTERMFPRVILRRLPPPRPAPGPPPKPLQVQAVRRFNRFYTARADLLSQGHLGTDFTLAEARLLFEIAQRAEVTAKDLCDDLRLDAASVSRGVAALARRGLVARRRDQHDGRRVLLSLTGRGRETFAPLDRAASERVASMLGTLAPSSRPAVLDAMGTIRAALLPRPLRPPRIRLRAPAPGDLGWVVERHGALYAAEYGYDERFEGLVARIVADFVARRRASRSASARRERAWVAEVDGARAGCVFLVRESATVARLRLLLVEPWARGHRLGARLVSACTDFARNAHYKRITLWTQRELASARRLYISEGYKRAGTRRHAMFGKPCVAETWELTL